MGSRIAGGPEPDRGSQEAPGSKASLAGDSGAPSVRDAGRGREHPQLAQSLGFSREQTPCVAALHHVFRRLEVDGFESALSRWAQESMGEATIAIDGKALRGMHGAELRECGWWHTLLKAAWWRDKRGVQGSAQGE